MSYAGAAANIVGGEMQGWASVLDKQAMGKAFTAEQNRQQGYADQAKGVMTQEVPLQGAGQAGMDLAQGAQDRQALYTSLGKIPLTMSSGGPPQGARQAKLDQAYSTMRGQTRARLGAYSDWALNEALRSIQTQESLRQVSNFAQGTASVFPYKMYEAQHSYDDLAMAGAAISSIGGGAADYAKYASAPSGGSGASVPGAYGPAWGSGYSQVPDYTSYNPYTNQNIYAPVAQPFYTGQ